MSHPTPIPTPSIGDVTQPVNHEEAAQYARMHPESNLARCYIALESRLARLEKERDGAVKALDKSIYWMEQYQKAEECGCEGDHICGFPGFVCDLNFVRAARAARSGDKPA